MPSIEQLQKLNDYRRRIAEGEQIPVEELKACLDDLRGGRSSAAATAGTGKSKKAAAPPIDLNSLFAPSTDEPKTEGEPASTPEPKLDI